MSAPVVFVPDPTATAPGVVAAGGDLGRFASTLLSVAVAGAAEPGRLRRGRDYLADGAVLEVAVAPGLVTAQVQGSASEPYRVEVRAPRAVDDGTPDEALSRSVVTALSPQPRQLVWWCTCRDPERPCKHAVAALLGVAAELTARPDLLVLWRSGGAAPAVSSGAAGATGAAARARTARPPVIDLDTPVWRAYLGLDLAMAEAAPSAGEVPHGSLLVDGVDIGLAVRSAIATVVNVLNDAPQ